MRRALLAVAACLGSLSLASPASAGPALDQAVNNTLLAHCQRVQGNCSDRLVTGAQQLENLRQQAIGNGYGGNWWGVLRQLAVSGGIVADTPLGEFFGGGSSGGGGASGSWDTEEEWGDYCKDFRYRLNIQGTLVVPTLPLAGGPPMIPTRYPQPNIVFIPGVTKEVGIDQAGEPAAMAMWGLHNENKRWADKRDWRGVYKRTDKIFWFSTLPFFDQNGAPHYMLDASYDFTNSVNGQYTTLQEGNVPCPGGGFSGGNAHFYLYGEGHQAMSKCTWYVPNYSISPSGYYYPTEVGLPGSAMADFPNSMGSETLACGLSLELIRQIADELRKKIEQTHPPTSPVLDEDVKVGSEPPKIDDLGDPPTLNGSQPPQDPPDPVPTNPPTGGGGTDTCDFGPGGCDNPNTATPTLDDPPTGIMDPIFNWLPDLPSITFPDLGEPGCPVWHVNLTDFGGSGWQWLMDSHCDIAEQNRAAIGALMLAIWGIAAALVILRA